MKIVRNLLLIFLTFASILLIAFANSKPNDLEPRANNPFYPTQADMLNASSHDLEISDQKFEKICNKILTSFKVDKDFVATFKKDKNEFLKYRLIQRDLILPALSSDSTAYGSNYGISSDSYLIELNEDKLKTYKRALELYCLYNEFAQPESACTKNKINSLFQ